MSVAERSLLDALNRGRDEPVDPRRISRIARTFLAPDEFVHAALEGNALTWSDDPVLVVTDRRVLRLQQRTPFTPVRKRREWPVEDLEGAWTRPWSWFFGRVYLRLRGRHRHAMLLTAGVGPEPFVEEIGRLVAARGA